MLPRKWKMCQFTFQIQTPPVVFTGVHTSGLQHSFTFRQLYYFYSFFKFHEVLCISIINITIPDIPQRRGIWDSLYLRGAETSMNIHHRGGCWKPVRCVADKSSFYTTHMGTLVLTLHRNWLMNTSRLSYILMVITPLYQGWIHS